MSQTPKAQGQLASGITSDKFSQQPGLMPRGSAQSSSMGKAGRAVTEATSAAYAPMNLNSVPVQEAPVSKHGIEADSSLQFSMAHEATVTSTPRPVIGAIDSAHVVTGHAEPNAFVVLYDATLGTSAFMPMTRANADGSWSMTLPDGMMDGMHTIVARSCGSSGTWSDEWSNPIEVLIGDGSAADPANHPPKAEVLIDAMSKDTGVSDRDWVTRDGSAGRTVSGHLTQALAVGEKVQVSTDGGRTWVDAALGPDNTWRATDSNAHGSDWRIEARVINSAGLANTASVDVTLDITPPPSVLSVSVAENGLIAVELPKPDLVAGDMPMVGGRGFSPSPLLTLTSADIAAGKVIVDSLIGNAPELFVGVQDRAGNISSDFTMSPEPVLPVTPVDPWQAPKAFATIIGMSKDGEHFSNDWFTNDGAAAARDTTYVSYQYTPYHADLLPQLDTTASQVH